MSIESVVRLRQRFASALKIYAILLTLALLLRLPSFFRSVIDWDESIYFMMAQAWRAGHMPYTTLWDIKPIGLFAILALFQTIFGDHIYAIRIASVVATATTGFLICLIVRRLDRAPGGPRWTFGLFGGIAYVLCSIFNGGMAANAELFFAPFTSGAVLLALNWGWQRHRPIIHPFVVGLLIGVSGAVKYVALVEGLPVLFALGYGILADAEPESAGAGTERRSLTRRFLSTALFLGLGTLVPLLLPVPIYWLTGHFQDLIDTYYTIFHRVVIGNPFWIAAALHNWFHQILWSPLYLAAVILIFSAVVGSVRRHAGLLGSRDRVATSLLLVWLFAGFVGVGSLEFIYGHYFLQLLPPLCATTGWVVMRLFGDTQRAAPKTIGLLLALILAAQLTSAANVEKETLKPVIEAKEPGIGWLKDTPAQIAAAIRPILSTSPGETIYVFDYQPIIYPLAGVTPPTRYALPLFLVSRLQGAFTNIDVARAFEEIMVKRPLFIIVARDAWGWQLEDHTPATYERIGPVLAAKYQLWKTFDEALIYRRSAP
jgi:4-amino-4-deoxy-L-arabinose transferase-like glycosyltransferase